MECELDQLNEKLKLDDEALWKAFLEGDQKALSELFIRHYTALFHYGIQLIAHEADVKDGIQQLFMKLCHKKEKLEQAHSVEFYLLFSLRRILLRKKKQRHTRKHYHQIHAQERIHAVPTIEDKLIEEEQEKDRREKFQLAFQSLTNRQREVFILRLQHGLTNKEISELIGITHQRVRNCICESTRLLKSSI